MKTEYFAPRHIDQVTEPLWNDPEGTMLMAGGTALLWAVRLLGKPSMPRRVIGLQNLRGILGQVKHGPEMDLGALVSLGTLAGEVPGVEGIPSILAQACRSVGFPGIRRTATLGGNLANGVMPSQLLPVLAALGARIHIRSRSKNRTADFGKGVAEGHYYPITAPGDLITSISILRENVETPQSFVDFSWPRKDPIVTAVVFSRGCLRIAHLADQKLSLWNTEMSASGWTKGRQMEVAEAACLAFGIAPAERFGQVDAHRRRALVAKALGLVRL